MNPSEYEAEMYGDDFDDVDDLGPLDNELDLIENEDWFDEDEDLDEFDWEE